MHLLPDVHQQLVVQEKSSEIVSGWLKLSAEPLNQGHQVDRASPETLFEKPKKDRLYGLPDVEAAHGQDGVDFITIFALR